MSRRNPLKSTNQQGPTANCSDHVAQDGSGWLFADQTKFDAIALPPAAGHVQSQGGLIEVG